MLSKINDVNIDVVHVAIIRHNLADDYSMYCGAMMVSAMETCSKPIIFHILHEEKISFQNKEIATENISKSQKLVEKYGSQVIFHDIIPEPWMNKDELPCLKNYTGRAGFYRFYLPIILPNIDRIISFGSDVIVNTDLAKLIVQMPDTYSIAGALAFDKNIWSDKLFYSKAGSLHKKEYGIDDNFPYVNADVMILNLKKMREEKSVPEKALAYVHQHPHIPLLEETTFNVLFKDDCYLLNQRFNINPYHKEVEIDSVVYNSSDGNSGEFILHYGGGYAPWKCYMNKYYNLFWHYLSKTPWGNDGKVIDYMCSLMSSLPNQFDITNNVDKWIWAYPVKKKIKTLWMLTVPLWIKIIKRYL